MFLRARRDNCGGKDRRATRRTNPDPTGYGLWNDHAPAALDHVIRVDVEPETVVDRGRFIVDVGTASGDGAGTVLEFPAVGGFTAGEQWRLVSGARRTSRGGVVRSDRYGSR